MKCLSFLLLTYFNILSQAFAVFDNNPQGRQESSVDHDKIALQNSEGTMNLPVGWPQKKQRSRRFEISESKSTSSPTSESDGDSWDITSELNKNKSSKGRAKRLQIVKQSKFNEVKKGNECIIHRPGCDHWDGLDRKDKNKHAKRWQYFISSKAEREKKLSRRRELYNSQTGQDVIRRRSKAKHERNKRRLNMTTEEYRAFRDDRNKYRRELRIRKNTGAPVRKTKARKKDSL